MRTARLHPVRFLTRNPVGGALIAALAVLVVLLASVSTASAATDATPAAQTIRNGSLASQSVKYDTAGKRIDAHDGHIYFFAHKYYWYGTSYACGFDFNVSSSNYCGVKVYESTDLTRWKDDGFAVDPSARRSFWNENCGGATYGCYRPKVAYNAHTKKYVMWINESRGKLGGGYLVLTSSSPTHAFTGAVHQTMAYNRCAGGKLAVFGDEDLFVDTDGTAYLAYTAIYHKTCLQANTAGLMSHNIAIEKLNSSYTKGTGKYTVFSSSDTSIEAPALFRRGGVLYLMYSDPSCPYCNTANTAYATAPSPLGHYTYRGKVTPSQLGGQPMGVTPIASNHSTQYLFTLDQWDQVGTSRSITNQKNANYFFAPLSFRSDAMIEPIPAVESWQTHVEARSATTTLQVPSASSARRSYAALTSPVRLIDTRTRGKALKTAHQVNSYLLPAKFRDVAGLVVNVTAFHAAGNGDFRIWGGGATPTTSVINYSANRTVVANMAVIRPAKSGVIHVLVDGSAAQLIIDLEGSYQRGSDYTQLSTSRRLVDTRTQHAIPARGSIEVSMFAGNSVPRTAKYVVVNVTALSHTSGEIIASSAGARVEPTTPDVTFARGITANLSILAVPANGLIRFHNDSAGIANLIVDVHGYGTRKTTTILPTPRLFESTSSRVGPYTRQLSAGISYQFSAAEAGVPAAARSVIIQLRPGAGRSGYLTTFADSSGVPTASNLNFSPHARASNIAIVPLSSGIFDLYLKGPAATNMAISLVGYIG